MGNLLVRCILRETKKVFFFQIYSMLHEGERPSPMTYDVIPRSDESISNDQLSHCISFVFDQFTVTPGQTVELRDPISLCQSHSRYQWTRAWILLGCPLPAKCLF